ncbi:hypothetical protein Golob_002411 [Gossypium lobatum]|uniref:Disease resistance N-terminal domain-containing protein n=1 Tax=Gossypium lobatum TaxID=34289 RepID=A0A7J8N4W7_9ROSI|nr:hypothetical protein [Gossypium lobatum]
MAAREPFLVGLLQFLLNSLASGELMDFRFHGGIQEKLNKWRKMLFKNGQPCCCYAFVVLKDTEQKQLTDATVKIWVSDLRYLLYDMEDTVDEVSTESLRDGSSDDNFSIIPIVGMDGVGNTTLAHLIYNDGACKGFDPKVWVDQSYDDLDVANETLLNMRKWYCKEYQLNAQLTLRREFSQKRFFFLILDNAQSNNIVDIGKA